MVNIWHIDLQDYLTWSLLMQLLIMELTDYQALVINSCTFPVRHRKSVRSNLKKKKGAI